MGINNANLVEDIKNTKKDLKLASEAVAQAHNTFTTHYNTLFALMDKLDNKCQEIEVRENAVDIREKDMATKNQQLQEREKKCVEREQQLEAREKDVSIKEDKWKETENTMQQNAAKLPSVIQFNVGGTGFAISKEKLLQHKGSLFEQILTSNHSQSLSSGHIFIDRDPTYFPYVIRYLYNGCVLRPANSDEVPAITQEFAHFQIPLKFSVGFLPRATLGELVKDGAVSIKEWIPNYSFRLCYKASIDGFASADFHKRCDNKGPTLAVIRSTNGYLFGGYTPLSWDSSGTDKTDVNSFIFTLSNPHNIPPTKYTYKQGRSMHCNGSYGPIFGDGSDLLFTTIHTKLTPIARYSVASQTPPGKGATHLPVHKPSLLQK